MRLAEGGSHIDRGATVRFRFDDVEYEGFAGDTIASALLANDVRVAGRGIYTGRPRGVFTAGSEEPNALVQVRWPSGTASRPCEPRSSRSRTGWRPGHSRAAAGWTAKIVGASTGSTYTSTCW